MRYFRHAKIFFLLLVFLTANAGWAAEITVFAAASLTDALRQVGANYEKASSNKVVFNFAASGTLARQIEAGAPADIFFSADEARMDDVEKQGLLINDSRTNLLGNTLVIVSAVDAIGIHSPADLTNAAVERVAVGDPMYVPAGTYAKAYLKKLQLWPALKSKVIPCANVRAVLAAVASGNVDAGFVYKTDAAISKKVRITCEVPAAEGPKIIYPVARLKDSPQPATAKKFMAYLSSDAAAAVFRRFGFLVPPRAVSP